MIEIKRIKHMIHILFIIYSGLWTTSIFANVTTPTIVLIPAFDGIIVPITIQKEVSNVAAPSKPSFQIPPPSSTVEDSTSIVIYGESGSSVFVNGKLAGVIGNNGHAIIALDTSGEERNIYFEITLRDAANNTSEALIFSINKILNPKFDITYKGLTLYQKNLVVDDYSLSQLTDTEFNALTNSQKLTVANTLLGTLFFGYPQKILQEKINSGSFISNIRQGLEEDRTDKAWLENYILDDEKFKQYDSWAQPQAINILSRFYAMKELDSYFLKNWIAYILTQTIMFSPAYELESTHTPNIANVYNRIVTFLNEESGMRYLTYVHMMSESNWRRFRSPEDNGREMLEIFTLDMNDSHVPIAGKALQNWKLNTDSDTLEVSLNQNRDPLSLFGTIVTNGDDFYRELVKSELFTKGVTKRLVDFFFPEVTEIKKQQLINTIVSSHPETWQDILLQIIFSKEYLLHNQRAKSAEETFFSFAKKIEYKHRRITFYYLKNALTNMHQASMKYKLGKLKRVPLDTLSFAYYHKFIREEMLWRKSDPNKLYDYDSWSRQGWSENFVSNTNYTLDENDGVASLESFINYLFIATISRNPTTKEITFFKNHMLRNEYAGSTTKVPRYSFNLIQTSNDPEDQKNKRELRKRDIAKIILDYISRLSETYTFKKGQ